MKTTQTTKTTDPIAEARSRLDAAEDARRSGVARLEGELRAAEANLADAIALATAEAKRSAVLEAQLRAAEAAIAGAEARLASARHALSAAQAGIADPAVDAAVAADALRVAEVEATRAQRALDEARRAKGDIATAIEKLSAKPFAHAAIPTRVERLAMLRGRRLELAASLAAVDAEGERAFGAQWSVTTDVDDLVARASSNPRVMNGNAEHLRPGATRTIQRCAERLNLGSEWSADGASHGAQLEALAAGTYEEWRTAALAEQADRDREVRRCSERHELTEQAGRVRARIETTEKQASAFGRGLDAEEARRLEADRRLLVQLETQIGRIPPGDGTARPARVSPAPHPAAAAVGLRLHVTYLERQIAEGRAFVAKYSKGDRERVTVLEKAERELEDVRRRLGATEAAHVAA